MDWKHINITQYNSTVQLNYGSMENNSEQNRINESNMLWFWLFVCLRCLTPLSIIFQLYRGGQFICEGNQFTRRKPPICLKLLTNFII